MLARTIFKQLTRACFSEQKVTSQNSSSSISDFNAGKELEVPVHLRSYDKAKYEVPLKKIKKNSGYALVQIEPFPRGRVMKICYHILAQVKKGIPEDFVFRILTEEKIKYIMKLADEEEDIQKLERHFGGVPIEIFIRKLADQIEVIEVIRKTQPWNLTEEERLQIEEDFIQTMEIRPDPKNTAYKKIERPKLNLL